MITQLRILHGKLLDFLLGPAEPMLGPSTTPCKCRCHDAEIEDELA